MSKLKETTLSELAKLAKDEIKECKTNYAAIAAAAGVVEQTVRNVFKNTNNSQTVKPETYVRIMSFIGIHVEVVYSPGMVQYYYKKLKKAK